MTGAAAPESLAVALHALTVDEIEQLARSAVPDCDAAPSESQDVGIGRREGAASRDFRYEQERLEFARDCALEESTQFGAVFRDRESGETISYAYWAQSAAAIYDQLELDLSGPNFRAAVRQKMAQRFRGLYAITGTARYKRLAERLEGARLKGGIFFNHQHKKIIKRWELKAGLNLYCPDDARENAKRLDKRYRPYLLECHKAGYRLQYCVLTTPSCAPGQLKKMQRMQFRRFRKRIIHARYPDGSLVFPEIKGALVVQESPLGWNGDWHAHLNVIFVVRDFLDFGKLRHHWRDHLHIDPPLGRGLEDEAAVDRCIGNALREIIKYAVAAVSAKSEEKATAHERRDAAGIRKDPARADPGESVLASADSPICDSDGSAVAQRPCGADRSVGAGSGDTGRGASAHRPAPPGMTEWVDEALIEYDSSNVGHHRTRTYGCLRGVAKPPKEELGQETFLGWRVLHAGGYRDEVPLLRSIPEKISTRQSAMERWIAMLRGLGLSGVEGAGTLGDSIPRDVLHTLEEKSDVL